MPLGLVTLKGLVTLTRSVHWSGKNGSPTKVGLRSQEKVRSRDGDQPWPTSSRKCCCEREQRKENEGSWVVKNGKYMGICE